MSNLITWLTINRNCNLSCSWCYQKDKVKSSETMDYGLAEKLIDLSWGLNAKNIILIGGEPTMHPRFFDIVKLIKNKALKVNVVSNSIRFSNHKFVNIATELGVDTVTTSIKSSSKKKYINSN